MKLTDINTIIENTINDEVRNIISEEINNGKKEVYHIKADGEPVATFNTEEEAMEALPAYKEKHTGELIIEKGVYESHEDMIDKLDEMGEELEEKENQNMENQEPMEGNAFTSALEKAKDAGEQTFTVDGKEYDVEECWKQLEEEELSEGDWSTDEEEECNECGDSDMTEELKGDQHKIDANHNGKIDGDDFKKLRDVKEGEGVCNECGGEMKEGVCNECGNKLMENKKKKVLRLTESQMLEMIKRMVSESVPGLNVTKQAQAKSKSDNEAHAKEVGDKIKKATSFDGNDNPEFPKQIGKGEKVARQNTPEEDEEVAVNFAGLQNLEYDNEPSQQFKDRLKMSIIGDKLMGNGTKDAANVVKTDTPKKIEKQVKNREEEKKKRVLYKKEAVPVTTVNESKVTFSNILNEEIEKMKKISEYNKKTQ